MTEQTATVTTTPMGATASSAASSSAAGGVVVAQDPASVGKRPVITRKSRFLTKPGQRGNRESAPKNPRALTRWIVENKINRPILKRATMRVLKTLKERVAPSMFQKWVEDAHVLRLEKKLDPAMAESLNEFVKSMIYGACRHACMVKDRRMVSEADIYETCREINSSSELAQNYIKEHVAQPFDSTHRSFCSISSQQHAKLK